MTGVILRIFVKLVVAPLHGSGRVRGRELVAGVQFCPLGGGDGSVEEWISGVLHPGFEPVSHLLEHAGEGGISREVVRFVGVVKQIVELFRGYGTLCVTVGEDDVLSRAVVYVG